MNELKSLPRDIRVRPWHPARSLVGLAVASVLHSAPVLAADPAAASDELEEVLVTATRRVTTLESVPYAISVVGADQLERTGITDMRDLAAQVPGLSMYDFGARFAASNPPIIRGINATSEPRGFRSFEQDPVGIYVGNAPISGYFQLEDIKQVEVLRGPQGTLYGAGALGGALRFIPNEPELGKVEADLQGEGSRIDHSSGTGYGATGMLNLPLGETAALRLSGKYAYDPGWINVFGLLSRTNNSAYGIPLLANPSDPVDSEGIYHSQADWNWQRSFTTRAALLWKPSSSFSAELAFLHADANGDGSPTVNYGFGGGAYPLDPRVTAPAGGHYQDFSQIDQPWWRHTNLTSLDLSFDMGFATLSSTSSYHTNAGDFIQDESANGTGVIGGLLVPYYSGTPANPRFVWAFDWGDQSHVFNQEIRLVSNAGEDKPIDYVVGAFFQHSESFGSWYVTNPGSPERAIAQGCGSSGSTTPCLITGPNDLDFYQIDHQSFRDFSLFGELTWHFAPGAQVTFGTRHFSQKFTDSQIYWDYTFATFIQPVPHDAPASKTVFKVNPSWEFSDHQYLYADWSQGFRRGGANSVPYAGFYQESPLLRYYQPDKTDNYELGLKGRFSNGMTYTLALFDIQWDKPQISANLPSGNLAVYNAISAVSEGIEFESTGPLGLRGLTYAFSFAYADSHLSSNYSLPANNGAGQIEPGELQGTSGTQLPGSPKTSVAATLTYAVPIGSGYDLAVSVNGAWHDAIPFDISPPVASVNGWSTIRKSSSFETMNLFATIEKDAWRWTAYITNLTDRQNLLEPPPQLNQVGNLTDETVVSPPRQVGVRIGYRFKGS